MSCYEDAEARKSDSKYPGLAFPAETREEFRELISSDPETVKFVRSAEEWQRESARLREPGGPLESLSEDQFAEFTDSLTFRNGGLAGAKIGVLAHTLSYAAFIEVFETLGIGRRLGAIYTGWKCAVPGSCVRSDQYHVCTDKC